MKKTFLLLLSVGTLTSVFAQGGRDDRNNTRDIVLGRNDHQPVYNTAPAHSVPYVDFRKRDAEIARITADFNRRIDAVQRDWRMRSWEKSRQISQLQREKEQAIRDINARYQTQKFDHRW